eukprot:4280149-Amphidinium_carterae.1
MMNIGGVHNASGHLIIYCCQWRDRRDGIGERIDSKLKSRLRTNKKQQYRHGYDGICNMGVRRESQGWSPT